MEKFIINYLSLWFGICWIFILPTAACNNLTLKATAKAVFYTALAVAPWVFLF